MPTRCSTDLIRDVGEHDVLGRGVRLQVRDRVQRGLRLVLGGPGPFRGRVEEMLDNLWFIFKRFGRDLGDF